MEEDQENTDKPPGGLSLKSNQEPTKPEFRVHDDRPESPVPSCVSIKSDHSMGKPINFKDGHHSTDEKRDHQERPGSPSPSCVSMKSDHSKGRLIDFKDGHHSTDEKRVHQEGPVSPVPSCVSMKSDRSMGHPINFKYGHHSTDEKRSMRKEEKSLPVSGTSGERRSNVPNEFPLMIEDWTKEQVRQWLVDNLRVPQQIAQHLYDEEMSGACLAGYEKQDLFELDVPRAQAILIFRQVQRLKEGAETSSKETRTNETRAETHNETAEVETVSLDSGFQSQSSSLKQTLRAMQTLREKIKSLTAQERTDRQTPSSSVKNDEVTTALGRHIRLTRRFDKSDPTFIYSQNDILPPMTGPSNLLDPVHEYHLLPRLEEASEKEILYEFTKEVFCFAASCMNSRTNGTVHFGVNGQPGQARHGQIIGHNVTSFNTYNEAFESGLKEHFEEQHINAAKVCIRPPQFFRVQCTDGTMSDKWVTEVDVVPTYAMTQESIFHSSLHIASAGETQQHSKTECLFVRDGNKAVNVFDNPNPRKAQEEMKRITDKIKCWAAARKSAEERDITHPYQGHQGQRLKQLITLGRDTLENSLQVLVVTDKCNSSQLEHLDFLKELKLFAVLEFDPESEVNGTCNFYRRDHIANIHYPRMYNNQDGIYPVIGKLNLFQQTSWVFCNGRAKEESDMDKPLTTSEWLKKRSGEVNNMVSFLCSPDFLSRRQLLVIFILHSAVTDISSPFMETFCAIHRTLEGVDNMMCICKDSTVFSQWKQLVESRCKEDITSKCIYELSLDEINCTVQKVKEPQTQSSKRYLPSSGSSSVLLTKKDEESMTVLDILSENECENTEIETKETYQEFKMKTEEEFYRGGKVTWWNFYLSERPGCLPFIKRDTYDELYNLITPVEGHMSRCVMMNLFHHPGCGGTTLAMHVLWNLRNKFRCAVVKNNKALNSEIALQVTTLLTCGKQEQSNYTPVLLLVDNWDDIEDLKQCILMSMASVRMQGNNLMVIILNCERTQFPRESSRNSRIANVFITNKLSSSEQSLFSEKLRQLKDYHKKPDTFYAFMIMTNNFSENYINNLVSNILKDLDTATKQGKLLSFLALLNTYVDGSFMSLSQCEELVGIKNPLWNRETLEEKMNPYSTLLIHFTVEEHGTYQAVRFLHQKIASNCLKVLSQKHKLSLGDITINLLHCDTLYKSCMGRDLLIQRIQSMLITRQRKIEGDDKDTWFSPLIEAIHEQEGPGQVEEVLKRAIVTFDKSATLPQALARYFCLKIKDFKSAIHWAKDAQQKQSKNSYIADTVGQVYKSHLKSEMDHSEKLTTEVLDECVTLARMAVKAFQDSQKLAKNDEAIDPFDSHTRKRQRSYNTSGYLGEMEVMMILFDIIKKNPFFSVCERYKRDKMLQFLKGSLSVSKFDEPSNTSSNSFLAVLGDHEEFLVSLRPKVKDIFSFFENYFTLLKPRSFEIELAENRNKRKISEYFRKYTQLFCESEKEKASEKASNPKLSLHQDLVDKHLSLEVKRADSFTGLLQCLNEKSGAEMEWILKKWKFIFTNSPNTNMSNTVNFIMANVVLQSIKPNSKLLKKYDELVSILKDALVIEGTNSNRTDLYYLAMLLMWPRRDHMLEDPAVCKSISIYVASAKKSFHRRFSYLFPARSAITHFFLGNGNGLQRVVSKLKIDQIVLKRQSSSSGHINPNQMWLSGEVWKEPEVNKLLLRVKGKSENNNIYVYYGGNVKIPVRPVYLGGLRSGCSQEEVTFYLGFSMEGPVAYDVKYENEP